MSSSTGVARVAAVLAEAADIKVRQAMATIEIEEDVWVLQDLARRAAGKAFGRHQPCVCGRAHGRPILNVPVLIAMQTSRQCLLSMPLAMTCVAARREPLPSPTR